MKVLVTGAAGFIGSHAVLELLEAGHNAHCLDNFFNAIEGDSEEIAVSLQRVVKLTGKTISFEKCDVCNLEQLDDIFAKGKFDAVMHLASLKGVGESVAKPYEYYSNNLTAGLNIIKIRHFLIYFYNSQCLPAETLWAACSSPRNHLFWVGTYSNHPIWKQISHFAALCEKYNVKNFIFSSSATVYGAPKELPITENSPTGQGITNPYGQTKYMMEQILLDVGRSDPSWNIIILRYFNPVGAHSSGQIGENPKGIPNNLMPYVSQVAAGKLPVLTIYGDNFDTKDGTGVRDYIHVVDLAKGHVKALERIEKVGHIGTEIYNLGTGRGYSVLEMVKAFEKASGMKIATKVGPPRPGDLPAVYCDPSLAQEKLDWSCEFGLEEMCRDLWNWQRQNPNGLQS